MKFRWWFAFLVFSVAIAGAVFVWLFRTSTTLHALYGRVSTTYRWGHVHSVSVDYDDDGRIDYFAIWPGYYRGEPPTECWIDPEGAGYFKFHIFFIDGTPARGELDRDGDGVFEAVLSEDDIWSLAEDGKLNWKGLR